MTNNDLLKQLNNLKTISADKTWKEKNRQVLISQIYGTNEIKDASNKGFVFYFKMPFILAKSISQPTFAAIIIFLFIFSGGTYSLKMAERTKPGDSLYLAKIASEKTQFAFTFDEKEKARLNLEFAKNRVEEMNQLIAESSQSVDQEKVGTLLNNYQKEINEVKDRIAKMDAKSITPNETEGDSTFHSANLNKDNQGIQLSEPTNGSNNLGAATTPNSTSTNVNENQASDKATSTANNLTDNISTAAVILKEAEKLLNEEKYNDTLVKLEEANKSISQVDQGEVKGVNEKSNATTTPTK